MEDIYNPTIWLLRFVVTGQLCQGFMSASNRYPRCANHSLYVRYPLSDRIRAGSTQPGPSSLNPQIWITILIWISYFNLHLLFLNLLKPACTGHGDIVLMERFGFLNIPMRGCITVHLHDSLNYIDYCI